MGWSVIHDHTGSWFDFGHGNRRPFEPGWLIDVGGSCGFLAESEVAEVVALTATELALVTCDGWRLTFGLRYARVTRVEREGDGYVIHGV